MAAYSLYELLRTLVDRVGWPSEDEKRTAHESIAEAERMQIFGNLASSMACDHPEEARTIGGKCADCGRQIENNQWQGDRHADRVARYQANSGRGW